MLAGAMLFSSAASAATIDATFNGVSPKRNLTYTIDGGTTTPTTQAGTFNWYRTGGSWAGTPNVNTNFITFCIELVQNIATGNTYTYRVAFLKDAPIPDNAPISGPMGVVKADYIMELWSDQIILGGGNLADPNFVAAMQTAVWEIVYDDGLDLGSGTFQAISDGGFGFAASAQGFLDALDDSVILVDMRAMSSETLQDQTFLTVVPTGEDIPVPAALAMGLPALGLISRRRR